MCNVVQIPPLIWHPRTDGAKPRRTAAASRQCGATALSRPRCLYRLWHHQVAALRPLISSPLKARGRPLPNCPILLIEKQLLSELRQASTMAHSRCVVSRYATAWAESLGGAMSGHQSWALLCRYTCLLLLAEIPKGVRGCALAARGSISKAMKGLMGGAAQGSADCRKNWTTALIPRRSGTGTHPTSAERADAARSA